MNTKILVLAASALTATALLSIVGCKQTSTPPGGAPAAITNGTNSATATASTAAAVDVFEVDTNSGLLYVFGNEVKPADIGNSLSVLSFSGALAASLQDTNCIPYLRAVVAGLDLAITSGDTSPANVTSIMQNISIKELHDPTAIKVVTMLLTKYQAYYSKIQTTLGSRLNDLSPYFVPGLQGIRDGISQAVN